MPTLTQSGSAQAGRRDGERDRALRPVEDGLAAVGLVGDRVEEREPALVLARGDEQVRDPGELVLGGEDEPGVVLLSDGSQVAELRGHDQVGAERGRAGDDVTQPAGGLRLGRRVVGGERPAHDVAARVAPGLGQATDGRARVTTTNGDHEGSSGALGDSACVDGYVPVGAPRCPPICESWGDDGRRERRWHRQPDHGRLVIGRRRRARGSSPPTPPRRSRCSSRCGRPASTTSCSRARRCGPSPSSSASTSRAIDDEHASRVRGRRRGTTSSPSRRWSGSATSPRGCAGRSTPLFGPSEWPAPRRHPVREVWETIDEFMRAVARHHALDPTLTELVRLRGARQHDCRLCKSRRSVAAIEAGADEALFTSVDDYASSDLPPATKAALALVDAIIWHPEDIGDDVVADVRAHLAPEQAVEVVLDVIRNATNKIAVALGADAARGDRGRAAVRDRRRRGAVHRLSTSSGQVPADPPHNLGPVGFVDTLDRDAAQAVVPRLPHRDVLQVHRRPGPLPGGDHQLLRADRDLPAAAARRDHLRLRPPGQPGSPGSGSWTRR